METMDWTTKLALALALAAAAAFITDSATNDNRIKPHDILMFQQLLYDRNKRCAKKNVIIDAIILLTCYY